MKHVAQLDGGGFYQGLLNNVNIVKLPPQLWLGPFLDPWRWLRAIKQDLFRPFAAANSLQMKQFDFMLPRFIKGIKQAGLGFT